MIKRLFEVHPWKIRTHLLDQKNKRLQESLTSIGNGYMGMRGNFEEQYSGDTHQGTYIAGVWYPDKTRVGWWKNGYPDYFGKVINATNFIGVDIYVNDRMIDLAKIETEAFELELDMSNGVLTRRFTITQKQAKVRFTFKRFVSIVDRELAIVHVDTEVLEGIAAIQLVPKIDGNVTNEDSNYDEMFWEERHRFSGQQSGLTVRTIPNDFSIPQFSVTTVMENQATQVEELLRGESTLLVEEEIAFSLEAGETAELTKYVAVVTSRDIPEEAQTEKAVQLLRAFTEMDFETHLERQTTAWRERWEQADVVIDGDEEAQQGIRFNIFQLFSTYYGEDDRLNVGPKGFTGEKYGGATYWDTEAYIIPMYLALTDEAVTEKLLQYRYKQLPEAFHNAGKQGLQGALYPMVTFTGVECHNEWEITFEEIHRNGSIAYAIYNYTNYTGNEQYLLEKGVDVLVGIARFWADRVHYSATKKQYMIHGVTGPNEYENNVNNNWYTNLIAQWELRYTLETLTKVSKAKQVELEVSDEEKNKWAEIATHMYLPFDDKRQIFVQHDTFLDKDLTPVADLDKHELPLNQNWSWDKILRSCYIKQADVLQGLYYFNDQYSLAEKRRNFDFYEPLTVHESSLSPSIHSILAAEIGEKEKAVELYSRTARLDLDNYNNDTEDGLHITSMSGSWLAIAQGFAGMRTANGKLSFAPFSPENWKSYCFKMNYRGRLLEIAVDAENIAIRLLKGSAIELLVYGGNYTVTDTLILAVQERQKSEV